MTNSKSNLLYLVYALLLSCGISRKTANQQTDNAIVVYPDTPPVARKLPEFDPIQVKYAKLLKVGPETIKNIRLYHFIDRWMHTPYKWGGTTEKGIDCSAFIQRLLKEVYGIGIPRTSFQQFSAHQIEQFGSINYLSEGDLVFFRTSGNTIVSHVGLYLRNGQFVNSSSSKGVSIAFLDHPYWKSRFVAAGRVGISLVGR